MSHDHDKESLGFNVSINLTPSAIEVLQCLFVYGPTYDGDVPSKSGRDELVTLGLAARGEGYQFLTATGVRLAIANGIDRKKQSNRRHERKRLAMLDQIEGLFAPQNGCQGELKELSPKQVSEIREVVSTGFQRTAAQNIDAP